MISFERFGYRMLGGLTGRERADLQRARYLGAAASSQSGNEPAGFSFGVPASGPPLPGQGLPDQPAAPPPPRVVRVRFGAGAPPPPAPVYRPPPPIAPARPFAFAPASPPAPAADPMIPVNLDRPAPCDCSSAGVTGALVGGAGVGLLMWLVGLATKEAKKKRRR